MSFQHVISFPVNMEVCALIMPRSRRTCARAVLHGQVTRVNLNSITAGQVCAAMVALVLVQVVDSSAGKYLLVNSTHHDKRNRDIIFTSPETSCAVTCAPRALV